VLQDTAGEAKFSANTGFAGWILHHLVEQTKTKHARAHSHAATRMLLV
jgi:hypothetical protein